MEILTELDHLKDVIAAKPIGAKADALGVGLSALCMVHCMAFPLLISFAPAMMKRLPGDDMTHRSLAIGIALAGGVAFRSGYRIHRKRWILSLFLFGMALVSAAAIIGEPRLPALAEAAITVCGSLVLVTAHWCNRSFCHSCVVSDCHECSSATGQSLEDTYGAG